MRIMMPIMVMIMVMIIMIAMLRVAEEAPVTASCIVNASSISGLIAGARITFGAAFARTPRLLRLRGAYAVRGGFAGAEAVASRLNGCHDAAYVTACKRSSIHPAASACNVEVAAIAAALILTIFVGIALLKLMMFVLMRYSAVVCVGQRR